MGRSLEKPLTPNNGIYTGDRALAEPSGGLLELSRKRSWAEPFSDGLFICL